MQQQNNIVMALITLLVLTVAGFGLYFLLKGLGFLIGDFDSERSRMVLAGCATLLLSAIIIARGLSRRSRSLDSAASAREALYDRILSVLAESHQQGRQSGGVEFDELERLLVLRASKSVLNCYLALRELESPFDPSDPMTQSALQRLIAEIRKDLGHKELLWSSTAAADLIFRRSEMPGRATLDSRAFKVVTEP